MTNRNIVFCILCLLAAWVPWWFVGALLIGTFLFYKDFFEGIFILLYLDIIYGTGLSGWRGLFPATFLGLFFLILVEFIRKAMLVQD